MYKRDVFLKYLVISIIAFFAFSLSFLLMYIDTDKTEQALNVFDVIVGVMFWLGLVIGIIMQILLSRRIKGFYVKNNNRIAERGKYQKIGLIAFFQNRIASFFDAIFIFSLVVLVAVIVLTNATGLECYIFTALTSFSFCAHCIFNGKNYFFIKNRKIIIKSLTKNKHTSFSLERKIKNEKH